MSMSDPSDGEDISSLHGQAATAQTAPSVRCASDGGSPPRMTLRDAADGIGSCKRPPRRKVARWWSNVLSRVSRSASSVLNQHYSPNLNDLLEEDGRSPIVVAEEGHRQDEDEIGYTGSERKESVMALRAEVERLKDTIRRLEVEKERSMECHGGNQCAPEAMPLRQFSGSDSDSMHRDNSAYTSPTQPQSIQDIPILAPISSLHTHQITRYSRQLLLSDGFGVVGQTKLLSSSILVVGAGGIGSSLLLYLAASGVGHVTIVDYDAVERTNLHRQIIHRDVDSSNGDGRGAGKNKARSAKAAMLALNPTLSVTALDTTMDGDNIMELVSRHDVAVDASDNPRTRYLLNDACILSDTPLVSGSAVGTEGQLTVYNYRTSDDDDEGRDACYRCLYPNPNHAEGCKSCSDNGVLGPVPGLIGVLQAVEVLKIITGIG